jgi:hypothetical protein
MFFFNPFYIYIFVFILWDKKESNLTYKLKLPFALQDTV